MAAIKNNSCLNHPAYQALKAGVSRFHDDVDRLEHPFGDGACWRVIIDHKVTLLTGIYRHPETRDPMIVIEVGAGLVKDENVSIFAGYVSSSAIELAFPARFLLRKDSFEGQKVFVVNLRSPEHLLKVEFIPDIISAMVGIGKHERSQLLELGLQPFEFPTKAA